MRVSKPLPGDIGLIHLPGVVGRSIRAGQWLNGDGFADFEHACIALGPSRVVAAHPGGASIDEGRGALWFSLPLTRTTRESIVLSALHYLGTPYSFLDYAALAARRFGLPVPKLREYIEDTGHMICSQLVDQCYADAGVHLFNDGRWPGYVTPGALYRRLA